MSEKFFELTTHFSRTTVPCAGDGCALCQVLPWRGLLYLVVRCNSEPMLLELGVVSSMNLEQVVRYACGSLKAGAVVELSRRGAKSPLRCEFVRETPVGNPVTLITVARYAMAVYKFPPPNPSDTLEDYEARCQKLALTRNEHLARGLASSRNQGVGGRS